MESSLFSEIGKNNISTGLVYSEYFVQIIKMCSSLSAQILDSVSLGITHLNYVCQTQQVQTAGYSLTFQFQISHE